MRSAARSARAGSSSCARGTPNAAITASPMNFSTVPPSASISTRIAAKKAAMTSFSCSASRRSPRPVESDTSANSTVTSLRSSAAGAGVAPSSAPQPLQKRASSGFERPQREQVATAEAYGSGSGRVSEPKKIRIGSSASGSPPSGPTSHVSCM
jgi:hypothetical protein